MNEGVLGGGAPGAAGGDYPRRRRRRISHHLDSYPTPSPRPSPPPPLSLLFLLPLLVSLHSVFSTSLSPPFLFPFCTSPPLPPALSLPPLPHRFHFWWREFCSVLAACFVLCLLQGAFSFVSEEIHLLKRKEVQLRFIAVHLLFAFAIFYVCF